MPEIPECLNKRYRALDELIRELSTMDPRGSHLDLPCRDGSGNDRSIKLMCDFWNILKEDPDCNLSQAVKQRMGLQTESCVFKPQHIACFVAKKTTDDKKKGAGCQHSSEKSQKSCCSPGPRSPAIAGSDIMPLSKVLCNLKEAASFDKKCNARINDLMRTQKELQDQIAHLENREREGVKLLKQADCMWTCMEEAYKKSLADSLHRQRDLMKELKEVEMNNAKWRKNKKDLDSQVDRLNKCHEEILGKISQKNNDIKCMDTEIEDFKKRIENNKKEAEAAKKSIVTKKQASDAKIANISLEVIRINKAINEEVKKKQKKEQEGNQYVREARDDLQQISRVLLQKKIENEDRLAEKNATEEEIELLKQTCDQCQNKCKNNQQAMIVEIKKLDQEIKDFKIKCIRCHQCTDTGDTRKFCSDCPKCMGERECLNKMDHCDRDPTMDCVCMSVKHKFLDNVFENMYTVLERQSKTRPGKAVADAILKCLKNSRNGKLNVDTRKILQDFILDTVKKNLNLTIVGGAVKTRCELDTETYNQLMTCLKKVTPAKPTKEDKGTASRKETCPRWGGSDECNCPGGHKYCVCKARAPLPPKDAESCPPPVYNKDDVKPGETQACPNKTSTSCGPDCYTRGPATDPDLSTYRKDPCAPSTCTFGTNMRAAQCVLGPEGINSPAPYTVTSRVPYDIMNLENKSCTTKLEEKDDNRSRPRERIIEEVMGRDYTEVPPIEKVTVDESCEETENKNINRCVCDKLLSGNALEDSISRLRDCSSDIILIKGTGALMEMLEQKNLRLVYTDDVKGNIKIVTPSIFPDRTTCQDKVKENDVKIILRPKLRKKPESNMNTSPLSSFKSKLYESSSSNKTDGGSSHNLDRLNSNDSDFSIRKMFKTIFRRGKIDKLTPSDELTAKDYKNFMSKPKVLNAKNSRRKDNELLAVRQNKEKFDDSIRILSDNRQHYEKVSIRNFSSSSADTDSKASLHILKGPSEVSLKSSTTFTTCETMTDVSEKCRTCDVNCLIANFNENWIPDSCVKNNKMKNSHNLNYDGKIKNIKVLHKGNIKEKKVLHQVTILRHQKK